MNKTLTIISTMAALLGAVAFTLTLFYVGISKDLCTGNLSRAQKAELNLHCERIIP